MRPRISQYHAKQGGFTLVELIVSLAIFVIMTALVVAKYGNFNQSVLMTDLAYDVALSLRTAQTYGVSVQGQGTNFNVPYGVDLCQSSTATGNCNSMPVPGTDGTAHLLPSPSNSNPSVSATTVTLFADMNSDGVYDAGDIAISTYTITRGAFIFGICAQSTPCRTSDYTNGRGNRLDVTFKRPDPSAIICSNLSVLSACGGSTFGGILIQQGAGTGAAQRYVTIQPNGEIEVGQ